MFCSQCGKPNDDAAKFCIHCGQPVRMPVHPSVSAQEQVMGRDKQAPASKAAIAPKNRMAASGKIYRGKLFRVLWLALAVFCLLMLLGAFSLPALAVYVVLLGGLFLFRKKLFISFGRTIGLFLMAGVIAFLPPVLLADDNGLKRDVNEIEGAFLSNDVEQIADCLHPESAAGLLPVFKVHEQELERIGQMMKTRKLIYADDYYAEYEVTENGQTFVMVFEKVDGVWRLSRF